ncbi:glycosyltransferase family 4 protein [Aestuariivirga litoralis]|uniref:glycosyltransferase family 4 protein n=1 Tax=Aestuariivirga litoralis TaxID=2650924 RepID=UPI0018C7AF1A|nr:glycosyltransferase family 4 protein [Aestuariivirga litoralis]MBG1231785.1 glycosyltransferase family 4 protein [Aestuariivirga litoralis]
MRIIHVFRSPVGGLFRHVRDLVRGQRALGHEIGIICDSGTGGEGAARMLAAMSAECTLGITRIPVATLPGLGDLRAIKAVTDFARLVKADVLHGHGAKGGVFARMAAPKLGIAGVYTPHGGSLHYEWLSPIGAPFLGAERLLKRHGTGAVFVCEFEKVLFDRKIGLGSYPSAVVYNGLWPEEFKPRKLAKDARDFLFVGEMRNLKGVDVLLRALASIDGATMTLVGDGRDQASFEKLAAELNLGGRAVFAGRMPMAEAMALGHVLILPSRHESFPYVVLEAMAAQIPLIASDVGGIPEALPAASMVPPGDVNALAAAMKQALAAPKATMDAAAVLQKIASTKFSAQNMAEKICIFYSSLNV